jgi:hypothetical protein
VTVQYPLTKKFVSGIIAVNLIGLFILAVWFRCRALDNIPGLNGDEAWYGVQAVQMLRTGPLSWQTPTGNPLNPLFFGPLALLNLWFGPSIVLLRLVAVVGGLLALLINWFLCRWVYDRRMAWITTAVLAVLPINIAYSRFAWDASQSLAATLPVVYFSLATVRFPQWKARLIGAAIACQIVATLVHPTNIFTAAAIAAALAPAGAPDDPGKTIRRWWKHPLAVAAAATVCILLGLWITWLARTPLPRWLGARLSESMHAGSTPNVSILFPRLLSGDTIYRFLAGSRSWFQWPFSADVIVFWLLIVAAGIILWRSWKSAGRREDGVLLAAWLMALAAFLWLAGPRALAPGQERFAICLIALTVISFCRALTLVLAWSTAAGRMLLLAASVAGWGMLADFQTHYFRFIEKTGGQAHLTFRTGPAEPKAAALKYILEHRRPGQTWIIAGQWWNLWPLRYLGAKESALCVATLREAAKEEKFAAAEEQGRAWFVEFSESEPLRNVEAKFAGTDVQRHEIKDYAGRAVLTIVHPRATSARGN